MVLSVCCDAHYRWPMQDVLQVLRLTRHWIHYGILTHVSLCVLVGAVRGLLGR